MGTRFRARSAVLVGCLAIGGLAACTSSSKPKADLTTYPAATMGTTVSPASAPATTAQVSPATTARPKPSPSQSAQSPTATKAHPTTPKPKTPTATPTAGTVPVPADVKRSGYNFHNAHEQPPAMPVTALQHSTAGARAFAEFFVKTIDWGYATTSGSYMRHYYSASCKYCANLAKGLDATAKQGNFHIGDRFAMYQVDGKASSSPLVLRTTVHVTDDTVLSAKRKVISSTPAGKFRFTMALKWKDKWGVTSMFGDDLGNS